MSAETLPTRTAVFTEEEKATNADRSPADLCRLVASKADADPEIEGVFITIMWKDGSLCRAVSNNASLLEWIGALESIKAEYIMEAYGVIRA